MLSARATTKLREIELDLEVEVKPGAPLALAGPSGSGKTSMLRVVAGLMYPDSGRVSANGETWLDTDRNVDVPPERRGCGLMFQSYALFPHMRAWENVAYGLGRRRRAHRGEAVGMLDRFGIARLADAKPRQLSGGERQRVALARALVRRPRAMLLDEPLSALDVQTRASAARELSSAIADAGVPTLLVTHDFSEAALLADQVAVLDRGKVVQQGTPAELADSPASAFVADLTGAVVLEGEARAEGGLTMVALDGGGEITSTDSARGPVAASVYPWEIAVEPPGETVEGSALNRLEAEVLNVTEVGNRARVGLFAGQHLTAEITGESASRLGLVPGARVAATWKATATRLIPR